MQLIIEYARSEGIRSIKGQVLHENTMMLDMCRKLGFHISVRSAGAVIRYRDVATPRLVEARDADLADVSPMHSPWMGGSPARDDRKESSGCAV